MHKINRIRLDRLLVDRGLAATRERARALIMAGGLLVEESVVDKAGTLVDSRATIRLKGEDHPYVSRGGIKLKGALDHFKINCLDLTALDVGASTGGFTDCLLHEGAAKVYALDVGYGQLAWKLRKDKRVVSIERTNIRYFDGQILAEPIDFAVIDVSFISLKLVIPVVINLMAPDGRILALIKPQFEVGREELGKQGVVRNPVHHQRVIEEIETCCKGLGLNVFGTCASPLTGPAGNREFFIYAGKVAADTGNEC